MMSFWEFVEYKAKTWQLFTESLEQKKEKVLQTLRTKFGRDEGFILSVYKLLLDAESNITNDRLKSAVIGAFINTYKPNPQDSPAHAIDRIKSELGVIVFKANTKSGLGGQNRKALIRNEIKRMLPDEPEEVIENIATQIEKGSKPRDVINAYLFSKRAVSETDKIIYKEGPYEVIEVNTWRQQDGLMDKHIDDDKPALCHPLFKGTKWCIRFKNYFQDYASSSPLYLVRMNGKPFVLGHADSLWLGIDDNPPEPSQMAPVAKIIMDLGIVDIALKSVHYLPNPVETFENTYAGKYKAQLKLFRKALLGINYASLVGSTVCIDYYDSLDKALENIADHSESKVYDMSDIDVYIDQAANSHLEISDLVYELNESNQDLLINILNEKYEHGEYGEDESWEDMDIEEALEWAKDDELIDILKMAAYDAYQAGTANKVRTGIMKELKNGDDNGFYLDVTANSYALAIQTSSVNYHISSHISEAHLNPDDTIDELVPSLWDRMNIEVTEPNFDPEFDKKTYNDQVHDQLSKDEV